MLPSRHFFALPVRIVGLIFLAPTLLWAQAADCPRSGTGTLTGAVRDETGALGLPGVRVDVRWEGGAIEATTGADGSYVVCGLPPDRALAAVARFAAYSSVAFELRVEAGQTATHDFTISLAGPAATSGETGRVTGTVIDAETEQPIEAAAVGMTGRGFEALTDSAGRFALDGIPAGDQELEVRHLTYGTQRARVDVAPGLSTALQVRLAAQPIEVEPIHVTITGRRDLGLEIRGFYERREWNDKLGLGHYFTWEDIERRSPRLISHMIADLPSTRLDCTQSFRTLTCELSFVGIPRTLGCQRADVFIDGVNVIKSDAPRGGYLDELIRPTEIAGVEVYPGPSSLPAEYSGASGSCGAIVIWTR